MTDTGPTDLGTIVVTGQTRTNRTQSFPILPATIFVPPPYAQPEAVRDGTWHEMPPCNNPAVRQRWGQDAAAASAVGAFLSAALALGSAEGDVTSSGPVLAVREFGADIRRVGGSIELGPVTHGPAGGGTVSIIHTGLTDESYIVGDVHFHPGGDIRPSVADWTGFTQFLGRLAGRGLQTSNRRIYIVVADPAATGGYATYVYDENDSVDDYGREVNPAAAPC